MTRQKIYSQLIFTNFSDGTTDPWVQHSIPNSGDLSVVDDPTGLPRKVMKSSINCSEDFSTVPTIGHEPRADVILNQPQYLLDTGKEYVYEISTFIPSDLQIETYDNNQHIIFQIHHYINSGSPPFSIIIDKSNYTCAGSSDLNWSNRSYNYNLGSITNDLGDWRVLYTPFYSRGGRVVVWKDNNIVLDYKGISAYRTTDCTKSYLVFGNYKWNWKTLPSSVIDLVTYYADVKLYKEVS